MNNSILIQNIEDSTVSWLRNEAERRGTEVEALILEIIRAEMNQVGENNPLQAYHDLDSLAGTWDPEQSDEFLKAIGDFEKVDEKLWV